MKMTKMQALLLAYRMWKELAETGELKSQSSIWDKNNYPFFKDEHIANGCFLCHICTTCYDCLLWLDHRTCEEQGPYAKWSDTTLSEIEDRKIYALELANLIKAEIEKGE